MVRLRFATYYENNPDTYEISKILEKSNTKIKSTIEHEKELKKSQQDRVSEETLLAEEVSYLKQSVEMKIELALMYLSRSSALL